MVLSNDTTKATMLDLNTDVVVVGEVVDISGDGITKCTSTASELVHSDDLPAKRKRKAQHRPDFVQMDDFSATKKQKSKPGTKKGTEEEFATTWICVECKEAECMMEPEATELLICDGVCRRVFHYPCAGLAELPPDDIPFICDDCTHQKHICSLCSNYGYDNEDIYKCSKSNCGMFYHESCLSMRNVEVTIISKKTNNGIDEVMELNNIQDDDDDHAVEDCDDLDTKKNIRKSSLERRFVCPAHSCWTCTQIDLKDELQQPDVDVDTKIPKSARKKKKVGGSFDSKKESFLTRCLECPIAYHITCIPPSANFHELATLCHEHSLNCKLPLLDPNDSLQVKIENEIEEKFGELIKKANHRKLKKRSGQNPFLPNISGTALTTNESDLLTALMNHENKGNTIAPKAADQGWFCLPCDMKDEVHSKLPTYKHVHSLQYDPNHRPPRITPQDDVCTCTNVCDENCINRMLYTECFGNTKIDDNHSKNGTTKSTNCAIGGNCGNRRIGQRLMTKCKPQREQGKGWGLVPVKNAFQGDLIQEYIGEVVDEETKERRLNEWYNEHPNDPNFYLMALQPGWFIDARDVANLSRFINHSCDPNCVLQQINVNGRMRCGIFAIRDIAAGEFLSYDYHFDTQHGDRFICCCGSANCRGTMKGGKDSGIASSNTLRKSKADIWEAAKASYDRDKKFLIDYEEDRKKRCTQIGAVVPGGDSDEIVANGAQVNKYKPYGQQQRLFLWRNIALGNNFERRFVKFGPTISLSV